MTVNRGGHLRSLIVHLGCGVIDLIPVLPLHSLGITIISDRPSLDIICRELKSMDAITVRSDCSVVFVVNKLLKWLSFSRGWNH